MKLQNYTTVYRVEKCVKMHVVKTKIDNMHFPSMMRDVAIFIFLRGEKISLRHDMTITVVAVKNHTVDF